MNRYLLDTNDHKFIRSVQRGKPSKRANMVSPR